MPKLSELEKAFSKQVENTSATFPKLGSDDTLRALEQFRKQSSLSALRSLTSVLPASASIGNQINSPMLESLKHSLPFAHSWDDYQSKLTNALSDQSSDVLRSLALSQHSILERAASEFRFPSVVDDLLSSMKDIRFQQLDMVARWSEGLRNQWEDTFQGLRSIECDDLDTEDLIGEVNEEVGNEARETLEKVDFFPIRAFHAIRQNPHLLHNLKPRDFECFTAFLLDNLQFENVIVTPASGDRGRDVLATKTIEGIPILFSFECKRYDPSRKITLNIMNSLLGSIASRKDQTNVGVLVTTSTFSPSAEQLILNEVRLNGRDFHGLVEWINQVKP